MRSYFKTFLVAFGLIPLFVCCQDSINPFGFNFQKDWSWEDLEKHASSEEARNQAIKLKELVSIKNARLLFDHLSRLERPDDVKKLATIQQQQEEWGGGFLGVIPEQIEDADSIPVPTSFENLIHTALFLAEIRSRNLEAIQNTGYPLRFKNKGFPNLESYEPQEEVTLNLDISGIQALFLLFEKDSVSFEEALEVARHPAFSEMLKHRKDLGYIPEPIINKEGLARFFQHAVSHDPLDMIWKWLNPWNFFNLAEISLNLQDYGRVVQILEQNKEAIENQSIARIAKFAPEGVELHDRSSFAVNWGIRGWATAKTGGMNLVQFKDDFDMMFRTLSHETYHRLQLQVCPVDDSRKNKIPREFEDLLYLSFPDKKDQRLFQTLSLVFMEGSATFIGGIENGPDIEQEAKTGIELLNQVYESIYSQEDFDKAENLENQGLRSNGPFYSLGYYMSSKIMEKWGSGKLGDLLSQGGLQFFLHYAELCKPGAASRIPEMLYLGEEIMEIIKRMSQN